MAPSQAVGPLCSLKQRIATDHHLNPEVKRFYYVKQPLYSSSRAQTAFTRPFSINKKDNTGVYSSSIALLTMCTS